MMQLAGRHRLLAMGSGVVLWTAMNVLAACGDEADTPAPGDEEVADARLIHEASDPALTALLDAPLVDDPAQAAYLLEPSDGTTLDPSTPIFFRWRVGPPEARRVAPPRLNQRPSSKLAFLPAPEDEGPLGWLWPIGTARAHGVPISGRGYYLVAEDEAGVIRYRLWTAALKHLPESRDWEFLAEATGEVQVYIVNAIFDNDQLVDGGGPWRGPSITLSF